MKIAEARALLNRWADRKPEDYPAVFEADALLAKHWAKRKLRARRRDIDE